MFVSRSFGNAVTSISIRPARVLWFASTLVISGAGLLAAGAVKISVNPVGAAGGMIAGTLLLLIGLFLAATAARHLVRGIRTFFS